MKQFFIVRHGNKILFIFFLLWAVVSSTPKLGRPLYYVALLAFAFMMLISHLNIIKKHHHIFLGVIFYIVLALLYKIVGYSSASWGNYMNQYMFFIPILLMLLIPYTLTVRQIRFLWLLMILVMAFNILDNIRLSILYPGINAVNREYLDEDLLTGLNLGGTTFYTFSLLFFNVCFFVFLNCKEKIVKNLALVVAIVSSIYIMFFCFKASVVVYFLFSLVLQYFAFKTKHASILIFALVFFALIAFFMLFVFQDEIVDFIISVSPNKRLTTRLVTLVDSENEEANTGTVTGRSNLYLLSIETWLSNLLNFFYGIGDHRAAHGAKATGIGQHADLLDSLARYGLIGLVTLIHIFRYSVRYLISLFDKKYKLQLVTILFILFMCGLTKGIFASGVGCAIFLLLPLCRGFVNENRNK